MCGTEEFRVKKHTPFRCKGAPASLSRRARLASCLWRGLFERLALGDEQLLNSAIG